MKITFQKLRNIGLIAITTIIGNSLKAQMIACQPADCPPCMTITVENNLPAASGCNLLLYWGYQGCTYINGFDVPIPPGGSSTKTGPCAKCPGDNSVCECPNKIYVLDNTSSAFYPWGNMTQMFSNGNSTHTNITNICSGYTIAIDINITGPNSATITFRL